MNAEDRTLLESTLARQLAWIQAADAKVSPVLTIDTAILGVIAALAPKPDQWDVWLVLVAGTATLLAGWSLIELFLASFPRTSGPKGSLVFFGGITEHPEGDFVRQILSMDPTVYHEDLARQCYRNAQIAGQKFRHVRRATVLLLVAILPWIIAIYWMFDLRHN